MELEAQGKPKNELSLPTLLEKGSWEALTVAEMRVVNDALLNIKAASRNRANLKLGARQVEKNTAVDQLLSSISPKLEPKKGRVSKSAMSTGEKILDKASEIDAFLLNPRRPGARPLGR